MADISEKVGKVLPLCYHQF